MLFVAHNIHHSRCSYLHFLPASHICDAPTISGGLVSPFEIFLGPTFGFGRLASFIYSLFGAPFRGCVLSAFAHCDRCLRRKRRSCFASHPRMEDVLPFPVDGGSSILFVFLLSSSSQPFLIMACAFDILCLIIYSLILSSFTK